MAEEERPEDMKKGLSHKEKRKEYTFNKLKRIRSRYCC